jgi:hypothetical protein
MSTKGLSVSVTFASHRCLYVDELLAGIVAQLDRDTDKLSMALVSRAFLDMGLNATWHKVNDYKLKRLLDMLPTDLWNWDSRLENMVRGLHYACAGRIR